MFRENEGADVTIDVITGSGSRHGRVSARGPRAARLWSGCLMAAAPGGRPAPAREKPNFAALGRAMRYVGRYRGIAALAYLALFVSTAAQLVVPQVVQVVIDTVARSRSGVVDSGAEQALLFAGAPIVLFAVARGLFAFAQSFMSERVSQSVAFDFRNDLYAKIQRLSFSYHDRTQTGQLMIRATDDVEKVRQFIGQGLLLAVQALVLVVTTLIVLAFTNLPLTLVVLPILPLAVISFMTFGSKAQPLFMQVQIRLSTLNTVLQENLAGIRVVKAFAREPQE